MQLFIYCLGAIMFINWIIKKWNLHKAAKIAKEKEENRPKFYKDLDNLRDETQEFVLRSRFLLESLEENRKFIKDSSAVRLFMQQFNLLNEEAAGTTDMSVIEELRSIYHNISDIESYRRIAPYYYLNHDTMNMIIMNKETIISKALKEGDSYAVGYYNGLEVAVAYLQERQPDLINIIDLNIAIEN